MVRLRIYLGFIVGAILVASSAAHSLLGWKQLGAALAQAQAPAEVVSNLAIGWHFAGVAMFTFGCIVLWLFANIVRGREVSLRPAQIIALLYVVFGIWALGASGLNPFFLIFLVPGVLLFVASWWPRVPAPVGG